MTLGLPTWVLVAIREPDGPPASWAGVGDLARLALEKLSDPFWGEPTERARAVMKLMGVVFGYWFACWAVAVGLAIFVHLVGSPSGSFR